MFKENRKEKIIVTYIKNSNPKEYLHFHKYFSIHDYELYGLGGIEEIAKKTVRDCYGDSNVTIIKCDFL